MTSGSFSPFRSLRFSLCAVLAFMAFVPAARSDSIDPENLLSQARILIDAGQSESAREILIPYLSSSDNPRRDYADYLLSLASFSDTDPEMTRASVDQFRRRYPDSKFAPLALFRLGQFYRVTLRNAEMAVSVYSQFLKEYPKSLLASEAHLWLASALIDAGQYDRAIATCYQALAIYEYGAGEKGTLQGLLDFARQSAGRPTSGAVTVDVRRPVEETPPAVPPFPTASVVLQTPPPSPPPVAPSEEPPYIPAPAEPGPVPLLPPAVDPVPLEYLSPGNEEPEPTVLMNYRDADIDDVLNALAEELGLTFIKDAEVEGKITIINPKKLTRQETMYLFESILELKGFAMVRSGTVYKILPVQKSYTKGLESYTSDQKTSADDRPITKVIRLNHALAQDVAQVLQPMIGDAGMIQTDISKNSIIVTGMASNLSRLEMVARTIDNAGSTDQRQEFKLKFLSAAEALPIVQKLLSTTQPENLGALKLVAGPTPTYLFAVGPLDMILKVQDILKLIDVPGYKEESLQVYSLKYANAERLAGFLETLLAKGLAASTVEGAPTRPGVISADRMTNSIVVLGSRAFHDIIAPLIGRLDYEGFSTFRVQVIPLKYANAPDLATKFENIVARGLGPRGEAYSSQILIQADARLNALLIASTSQSLLKTLGSLASALDVPAEEGGPRTVVYYLENADAAKLVTVLTNIFTKSDAPVIQAAKIVADEGTNSLIIVAMRENYDAVMETVMKLDIAPYQVLVEAVILEVTLDENTDLGVDWSLKRANVDFDLRKTGTKVEDLALTGLKQAVVKDRGQLDGLINALMAKTKTRVLATPRLFAANNQEASITIGDEVPVKTGSSTTTGGVTQNTFEYKDVGITLKVTPHINRKRQTVLDISQEIKSIRTTSVSTENPTFTTREAKTNAVLGDGQTVIIAGLIRSDRTEQESKVPVLGDLPLIGAAFRKKKDADVRTELMIFITPTVIETEAEMAAAVESQKKAAMKAGFGDVDTSLDSPASRPRFIQDFILK